MLEKLVAEQPLQVVEGNNTFDKFNLVFIKTTVLKLLCYKS